jgi:hypothetical protein
VPGLSAGTTVLHNATLGLSGPGRVTFRYLGTEADYENRFLGGGTSFDNKSGSARRAGAMKRRKAAA